MAPLLKPTLTSPKEEGNRNSPAKGDRPSRLKTSQLKVYHFVSVSLLVPRTPALLYSEFPSRMANGNSDRRKSARDKSRRISQLSHLEQVRGRRSADRY